MHTTLKIVGMSLVTLAFTAGSAMAGDGKNCDHKKKTAVKTTAATTPTAVLSTAERETTVAKKMKKTYSFEDALKLCQEKSVTNLQACIDYKTGKVGAKS